MHGEILPQKQKYHSGGRGRLIFVDWSTEEILEQPGLGRDSVSNKIKRSITNVMCVTKMDVCYRVHMEMGQPLK